MRPPLAPDASAKPVVGEVNTIGPAVAPLSGTPVFGSSVCPPSFVRRIEPSVCSTIAGIGVQERERDDLRGAALFRFVDRQAVERRAGVGRLAHRAATADDDRVRFDLLQQRQVAVGAAGQTDPRVASVVGAQHRPPFTGRVAASTLEGDAIQRFPLWHRIAPQPTGAPHRHRRRPGGYRGAGRNHQPQHHPDDRSHLPAASHRATPPGHFVLHSRPIPSSLSRAPGRTTPAAEGCGTPAQ